jgi:tetratricopeptide (TPR) repeat protein
VTKSATIEAGDAERAGLAALERGDPAAAQAAFLVAAEATVAPGEALWWGLARACNALGDDEGALAAVDRLLALSPRHLLGLTMKADHLARQGDGRAAYAFYAATVAAAGDPQHLPPQIRGEIGRAQRQMAHFADAYVAHLMSALSEAGFDPGRSSRRFAQSIDLLLGRKRLFVQTPTAFYFPELPQRQFYEREEFAWLTDLEARTPDIRDELEAVMRGGADLRPYLEAEANRPALEFGDLAGSLDWSAFDIIKFGTLSATGAAACPRTLAAVETAPLCRSPGRTPSVLF